MEFVFFIVSLLALSSAVGVIAFRNPIHSALCLIANLLLVAVVFAMLDAHFLATVQIIVYAGAIMVLVLFVLMLLNLKAESSDRGGWVYATLSGLVGLGLAAVLLPAVRRGMPDVGMSTNALQGNVAEMGQLLYGKYLFLFEAASVLILAAIVGAVMLARRERRGASGI